MWALPESRIMPDNTPIEEWAGYLTDWLNNTVVTEFGQVWYVGRSWGRVSMDYDTNIFEGYGWAFVERYYELTDPEQIQSASFKPYTSLLFAAKLTLGPKAWADQLWQIIVTQTEGTRPNDLPYRRNNCRP